MKNLKTLQVNCHLIINILITVRIYLLIFKSNQIKVLAFENDLILHNLGF